MNRNIKPRYTGLENADGRNRTNVMSTYLADQSVEVTNSSINYCEVPLEKITPRSINQYSQLRIDRLAKSIRRSNNRLISPITLVKAVDLPASSPVRRAFLDRGVDIGTIEYVIVAGERRYRAFLQLRAEEEAKHHEIGFINPFSTITANILTPVEAISEAVYYEDSNTQARQLSPVEAMRLFADAESECDSDEKKYQMLQEMWEQGIITKPLQKEKEKALKNWRLDKYCIYYLQHELGITGWTESSCRRYLAIAHGCSEPVKKALDENQFTYKEAVSICKLPSEEQEHLVDLWISGDRIQYREEFNKLKSKDVNIKNSDEIVTILKELRSNLKCNFDVVKSKNIAKNDIQLIQTIEDDVYRLRTDLEAAIDILTGK